MVLLRFLLGAILAAAVIYAGLYITKVLRSDTYKFSKLEQSGEILKLDRSSDLAGPDKDNNGISDDIDLYIRKTFKDEKQRKAVEQVARANQQEVLVNPKDKKAVFTANEKFGRAFRCIGNTMEIEDFYPILDQIHAFTFNTRKRARQYAEYSHALSGYALSIPRGDTCDE